MNRGLIFSRFHCITGAFNRNNLVSERYQGRDIPGKGHISVFLLKKPNEETIDGMTCFLWQISKGDPAAAYRHDLRVAGTQTVKQI